MFWIWMLQGLYLYIMGNLGFCIAAVTINYIIKCYNFSKIKEMAEKSSRVTVLRNNIFYEANSTDLVPGDIYQIGKEVPCDSILIEGNTLVN